MSEYIPDTPGDPADDGDQPQPEFLDSGRPSEDVDDEVDRAAGPAH